MGASQRQLIQLRECLEGKFSLGEIKDLCFYLGLDYDNIPGDTKADKTRELLLLLNRRDQLSELIDVGTRLRPDVDWASVFTANERERMRTTRREQPEETEPEQSQVTYAVTPEYVLFESEANWYREPSRKGPHLLGPIGKLKITNRRVVFSYWSSADNQPKSNEFPLDSIEDAEVVRLNRFLPALRFRSRGHEYTFQNLRTAVTALDMLKQAQAQSATGST